MTGYPLTNSSQISDFLKDSSTEGVYISANGMMSKGPVIFHAVFDITNDEIYDTYLDVSGWGKVRKTNSFQRLKTISIDGTISRALLMLMVLISGGIGQLSALK